MIKRKVLMKLKHSTHYMDVGKSSVKGRGYRSPCGAPTAVDLFLSDHVLNLWTYHPTTAFQSFPGI